MYYPYLEIKQNRNLAGRNGLDNDSFILHEKLSYYRT